MMKHDEEKLFLVLCLNTANTSRKLFTSCNSDTTGTFGGLEVADWAQGLLQAVCKRHCG